MYLFTYQYFLLFLFDDKCETSQRNNHLRKKFLRTVLHCVLIFSQKYGWIHCRSKIKSQNF